MNPALHDASRDLYAARRQVGDAEKHLGWLHRRRHEAEAALAEFLAQVDRSHDPEHRDNVRRRWMWQDDARRRWEDEFKSTNSYLIVPSDRPPTDEQINAAEQAIKDAEKAVTAAKRTVSKVQKAVPTGTPETSRFVSARAGARLFGRTFDIDEPVPDELVASLSAAKLQILQDQRILKMAVPA